MTLNDLNASNICLVEQVTAPGILGQRLCDLGLCPGVRVMFVRRAPLRDPIHVQVGSYHVALRAAEAGHVRVKITRKSDS